MPTGAISPSVTGKAYFYDANGRSLGSSADDLTASERYIRDPLGRVSKVETGDFSSTVQTLLSYDGTDSVKAVVDPKGLSTTYQRNGLGDLLRQHSPDTGVTDVENDSNGNPVKKT